MMPPARAPGVFPPPPGHIKLGRFGDIKPMMRELNLRKDYLDVKLVCQDGEILGHRFVIGAQSKYLRRLMQMGSESSVSGAPGEGDPWPDDMALLMLPDVKEKDLRVVIKFLYTGRLYIQRDQVPVIKHLLERVLYIDARITLPDSIPQPRDPSSQAKKGPDKGGGGGGGGGCSPPPAPPPPPSPFDGDDEKMPPKKRKRVSEESRNGNGQNGNANEDGLASNDPGPGPSSVSAGQSTSSAEDDVAEILPAENASADAAARPHLQPVVAAAARPEPLGPECSAPLSPPHSLSGDGADEERENMAAVSEELQEVMREREEREQKGKEDIGRKEAKERMEKDSQETGEKEENANKIIAEKKQIAEGEEITETEAKEPKEKRRKTGGDGDGENDENSESGERPPSVLSVSESSSSGEDEADIPEVVDEITREGEDVGQKAKAKEKEIEEIHVSDEAGGGGDDGGGVAVDEDSPPITEAPRIITKHTAPTFRSFIARKSTGSAPAIENSSGDGSGEQVIPPAPKVVAKRPGASGLKQLKRKGRKNKVSEESVVDKNYTPPASSALAETTYPVPSTSAGLPETAPSTSSSMGLGAAAEGDQGGSGPKRLTRTVTGSIDPAFYDDGGDDEDDMYELPLPILPPPIPMAPEEGMVLYRGKWMTKVEVSRIQERRANSGGNHVRPYNYKPFVTITGQSKQATVDEVTHGQDGEFVCPVEGCGLKYRRQRSLNVHLRRLHNPNMKAKCPECDKALSSANAIKKHLLSHRPESDWPFRCPLPNCGKKFQARGDLPKHWMTRKHQVDNIPPIGSDGWKQLLEATVCLPQMSKMSQQFHQHKSVAFVGPNNSSVQQQQQHEVQQPQQQEVQVQPQQQQLQQDYSDHLQQQVFLQPHQPNLDQQVFQPLNLPPLPTPEVVPYTQVVSMASTISGISAASTVSNALYTPPVPSAMTFLLPPVVVSAGGGDAAATATAGPSSAPSPQSAAETIQRWQLPTQHEEAASAARPDFVVTDTAYQAVSNHDISVPGPPI